MNKTNKPSASWTGDPTIKPRDFITLTDVLGTGGYSTPGNSDYTITLTLGVGYTGETYTRDALIFNPPGILSIPVGLGSFDNSGSFTAANSSPTGTQALAYLRNDQWIVLGTRDTRTQSLAGTLNPGETCLYSPISQGRVLLKADSSISLYTATSSSATAMGIFINPATDSISIVNSKGYGLIINDDGISLTMGGTVASIQLTSSGNINIIGTSGVQIDGTSILLGSSLGGAALYGAPSSIPELGLPSLKVFVDSGLT
jgi:hypothetical protein